MVPSRSLHQALLILRCVLRYLEADAALGEHHLAVIGKYCGVSASSREQGENIAH